MENHNSTKRERVVLCIIILLCYRKHLIFLFFCLALLFLFWIVMEFNLL
jgi:hypothetical protein